MSNHIQNIGKIKEAVSITKLIGEFVTLKPKGQNEWGCCPIHGEKTPSFSVSEQKGIYKCFGCGASGDAITFLEENEGKTFHEAVSYLAEFSGIEMEITEDTATPEEKEEKQTIKTVLKAANKNYIEQLRELPKENLIKQDLQLKRELSEDTIIQFQIGFAPEGWRFITDKVVPNGMFYHAEKVGLVKNNEEKNYDVLRNRVTIPIQSNNGEIIGFAGRDYSNDENTPKYINPKKNSFYDKDRTLYGLNFAHKQIRDDKRVIRVEGYSDVWAFHQRGLSNTVAACGTSFTETQAKILKRYTNHIIIINDGDKAGYKATIKDVKMCIRLGFKTDVYMLADKEDPESYAITCGDDLKDEIYTNTKNGFHWFLENTHDAEQDYDDQAKALEEICEVLQTVSDDFLQEKYIKLVAKKAGTKPKLIADKIKSIFVQAKKETKKVENHNDDFTLPEGVEYEEVMRHGFYSITEEYDSGIYFVNHTTGYATRVSNFTIDPLIHIYSKTDNKRLIRIDNGTMEPAVIEMPSKGMLSVEQFGAYVFDEGPYSFDGDKRQLKKIVNKLMYEFPVAWELITLGWQNEGFFAYSNYIYNGELKQFSNLGVVSNEEKTYFSPSVSDIQKNTREEDDMYENDRHLIYTEPPIKIDKWMKLFYQVYGDHALVGLPYIITTLFRDIIFKLDNNFPFVHAYGESQSGKSKFAESIQAIFFNNLQAFNLNSGTDFAFFRRMGRFKNCPVWFNEFDDNVVKDEWFQALKGIYDGEGRERGTGASKTRTETMPINCSLVLTGQYLSTKDDNSFLSRCMSRSFKKKKRDKAEDDNYNNLKALEEQGISGLLVDILQYREVFEKSYNTTFHEIFADLKEEITAQEGNVRERVLRNYCTNLTAVKMLKEKLNFPFTFDKLRRFYKKEIIRISNLINKSDSLSDFWATMEVILDYGEILEGFDFRIEESQTISIAKNRNENYIKDLGVATEVLYLRINNPYSKYAQNKSKQQEEKMAKESLITYLQNRDYYLGSVRQMKFSKSGGISVNSSCFAFEYNKIGVNLKRDKKSEYQEKLDNTKNTGESVPTAPTVPTNGIESF